MARSRFLAGWWCGLELLAAALTLSMPAGVAARAQESASVDKRLNVVMISLDTVRPDHLSCYGYSRQTTPHIDQMARDGIVFTQAFAQAPTTFPSHLSIFTSRYPTRQWVFWEGADLEPSMVTLTEALKQHGYQTAGFVSFQTEKFEPLLASNAFQSFDHLVRNVWLKVLPEKLFEWLEERRDQPFFLFVHGFDAHGVHVLDIGYDAKRFNPTYQGPLASTRFELLRAIPLSASELRRLSLVDRYYLERHVHLRQLGAPDHVRPDDLKHLKALYDAQLYYLDQGLGELFTALNNLGLMDQTLVVIFSDHGEAFGEHGSYASHHQLYDEIIRIALIIRDPRLKPQGRQVDALVQGLDIMPTILDLLGLPIPSSVQGRSLVPLLQTGHDPAREEVVVAIGQGLQALRTPRWKLISHAGTPAELYQVAKDPEERHNLITRHPAVAQHLEHRLDAVVSPEAAGAVAGAEQWMREHGYW